MRLSYFSGDMIISPCYSKNNLSIGAIVVVYWREYFAPWILERGYDYYLDGQVTDVTEVEHGYTGTVSGSDDYTVQIQNIDELFTDDDDEIYMYCTCPHADSGANCKHMAALLYAIEASGNKTVNISGYNKTTSDHTNDNSMKLLQETIDTLSPKVIRSELQKLLESDENLRASFLVKYNRGTNDIVGYINKMRKTAQMIRRECSDHHGFVDWRNASTYTSRLISEVLENLHDFTSDDDEVVQVVFDLSLYVLDMFATTDIDDDGDTQVITSACIELWEKILTNNIVESLEEHIFNKLIEFCDKIGIGEYIPDEIDEFISHFFTDSHFVLSRMAIVDKRIEQHKNNDSRHGAYVLSQSVMERLALMNDLGIAQSEIEEFKNKYWHLSSVRKIKMEELEALEDWGNLILLMEESKVIDKDSRGLFTNYSKKLVDCYNKVGAIDKAREELYMLVTKYNRGDLDAFRELKNYYHETEWIDVREEIFKDLEADNIDIKPLLAADNQKGRLMYLLVERFEKNRHMAKILLHEVSKYEKHLRPDYDKELLDLYHKIIMEIAKYAGARSHYREIVAALRRMLAFPGGKERVQEMLDKWRVLYYNRPAMQEELRALYSK